MMCRKYLLSAAVVAAIVGAYCAGQHANDGANGYLVIANHGTRGIEIIGDERGASFRSINDADDMTHALDYDCEIVEVRETKDGRVWVDAFDWIIPSN